MKVNGKEFALNNTCTLQQLLDSENYSKNQIAVELNYKIVNKNEYDTLVLNEDDVIEIVSFVGGG